MDFSNFVYEKYSCCCLFGFDNDCSILECVTPLFQFDSSVNAEFELEYLLLEGHCFDASTGQPPRGLEFTLGTKQRPATMDTIVMANLVCRLCDFY